MSFKTRVSGVSLLVFMLLYPASAFSQKQELGLTLGSVLAQTRTGADGTRFDLGAGTALQADYEHRVLPAGFASLYIGVHFLGNPQRVTSSGKPGLTRDIATIYLTPNLMLKLTPHRRISPWAVIGAGYGDYEQSTTTNSGDKNPAPRELGRGVFTYGGGVDVHLWHFIALRGEIRDFYTGSPAFNVPISSGQHNVVTGGGVVLRFGQE